MKNQNVAEPNRESQRISQIPKELTAKALNLKQIERWTIPVVRELKFAKDMNRATAKRMKAAYQTSKTIRRQTNRASWNAC